MISSCDLAGGFRLSKSHYFNRIDMDGVNCFLSTSILCQSPIKNCLLSNIKSSVD